jgi:hypothetical protein
MMSQVGFAPAGSMKSVRLIVIAIMAMGVFAVGLLSVPGIASAADPGVNNCSNTTVNVVCLGQINGNLVTVNIGDVGIGNNLTVLTNNLNNAAVEVAHIQDINILSVDLTTLVQTAVNTFVTTETTATTKVCSVLVTPPVTPTGSSTIAIVCS